MFWKTGTTPSTDILGYAIPRMPSNLAATKAKPGSLSASAKVCSFTANPPIVTVSADKNPLRLPDPYCIAKAVPFSLYVDDLVESYLLWSSVIKPIINNM